jgi:hypothetical protein
MIRLRHTIPILQEGYSTDAVNEFMVKANKYLEDLRQGRPSSVAMTSKDMKSVRFPITRWSVGYNMDNVDDIIDRMFFEMHTNESIR